MSNPGRPVGDVFDREAVYYISGPMTGIPDFNYPYFAQVAHRLRWNGLTCNSPHECEPPPPGFDEAAVWSLMIERCLVMMEQCDSIIMLPGWTKSKGARLELNFALDRDWPVYFYYDPPGRLINMTRRA